MMKDYKMHKNSKNDLSFYEGCGNICNSALIKFKNVYKADMIWQPLKFSW